MKRLGREILETKEVRFIEITVIKKRRAKRAAKEKLGFTRGKTFKIFRKLSVVSWDSSS